MKEPLIRRPEHDIIIGRTERIQLELVSLTASLLLSHAVELEVIDLGLLPRVLALDYEDRLLGVHDEALTLPPAECAALDEDVPIEGGGGGDVVSYRGLHFTHLNNIIVIDMWLIGKNFIFRILF
jgi:hypothetical protein